MPAVHPDDSPPSEPHSADADLRRSLERSLGKLFYEACSGVLQGLLVTCEWYFNNQNLVLTLYIHCPAHDQSERILNHINEISRVLGRFTRYARIQIDSPYDEEGVLLELEMDQFSAP